MGTYNATKCELTIEIPSGAAPKFTLSIKSGALAGAYAIDVYTGNYQKTVTTPAVQ